LSAVRAFSIGTLPKSQIVCLPWAGH